jgi:hypothetical protein
MNQPAGALLRVLAEWAGPEHEPRVVFFWQRRNAEALGRLRQP